MSATATFVIGIIGSGVLTIAGILAVALKRGPYADAILKEEPGRRG